jgi:glucose/arabinose dehydrogenase
VSGKAAARGKLRENNDLSSSAWFLRFRHPSSVPGEETMLTSGGKLVRWLCVLAAGAAGSAAAVPTVVDPALQVRIAASGFNQPTSMAFIGTNEMLVLEKATGQVKRVLNGTIQGTVLDLAVNSGSERGLLGVALDPNFASNGGVYLYWTESATGADSNVLSETPLLGNRVDRFVWNGSTLAFGQNIARFRAPQSDAGQPERGNQNGGVMRFGPDGKLYVAVGDVGRRGQLQNLPNGPSGPGMPDDQFGGPQPDNAHFTGVVVRLNPDGTAPTDNPFFAVGAAIGGEVGANLQKTYAYGVRNTFGMDFDPVSGALWMEENGDDAFDELNRVTAGMNSGWVQSMGPLSRLGEYKSIETASANGLQQIRWDPSNIANTQADALAAMYMLPGAQYSDPEFSWKYNVAPAGLGFMEGAGLGPAYDGNLFVGGARDQLEGGYLFRFVLSGDRSALAFGDADLADLVADNLGKFDITESESLLFGSGFGVLTDIQAGPGGTLFLVSLTHGTVYELVADAVVPEPPAWALIVPVLPLLYGFTRAAARRRPVRTG